MSPEPIVRAHALAVACLFVAAAALGSPAGALITAAVATAIGWSLKAKYDSDVMTAQVAVPPHRERLDRIVAGDSQASFGIALTAGALLLAFHVNVPDIGLVPATPVLLAVAGAAVYVSSLFDWYIILPRVSGLLGSRPCRRDDADHPSYPKSWRETTRWWYIHRIGAALILRFGLGFAFALTLDGYLPFPRGSELVAGALLGFLAAYMWAVPAATMQAGHPRVIVGQTVYVREARRSSRRLFTLRGRPVGIPFLRRMRVGPLGPREYVFDVALEAVQFARVGTREKQVSENANGTIEFERHPREVRLKDLHSVQPAERQFAGCETRCSGINWYCIENPRCFELK